MNLKRNTLIKTLVVIIMFGARQVNADFVFGEPENLGSLVNSTDDEGEFNMSFDGLELYFGSDRPGGRGDWDIWVTTRTTTNDDWSEPVNLSLTANSSKADWAPSISADKLSLYFSSDRSGSSGYADIWVTTRASVSDSWGEPVNLGATVNSNVWDAVPSISADGLSLFFGSNREKTGTTYSTLCYIYVTTRPTINDPWGEPVRLEHTVNTGLEYDSDWPSISEDSLSLFFSQWSPDGAALRVATRISVSDSWSRSVSLGLFGVCPCFSPDGSIMYFCSGKYGGYGEHELLKVSIEPIVDLNGDGIVDAVDMCIVVDNWGTDEPLCDIGPTPFGDGIVDVQDLIVLAEHLFEDVNDPTLIAHWALDETEGSMANDSVSGNSDIVMGDPLWQPTGGRVDGALELDGIEDCIISSTYPNPTEGPFSVVAWIKGGESGQVIISQPGGVDWLAVDAEGKLMTELKGSGRSAAALLSQALITDDQWHRIGLVWDGSQRMLCVDGVVVAEDTQNGLGVSTSGLYIGVGKNYAAGTFFSGLIDDVRIYNRAVKP